VISRAGQPARRPDLKKPTAVIGGQPLRDTELLTWCGEVIWSVLADL